MKPKLNFFATFPHYADHMIPIYHELADQAGDFFVAHELVDHLRKNGIKAIADVSNTSEAPMIVASHNDLRLSRIVQPRRKYVLMEHGVGITFPGNPSYAGGGDHRRHASLTLAPNQHIYNLTETAFPNMKQEIIGTPRMDEWRHRQLVKPPRPDSPTVAVTFHWDGSAVAPEAGTAFRHYKLGLPKLNRRWDMKLIAHVHPKSDPEVHKFFKQVNIEYEPDVKRLFERADILVNDSSSLLYEFMLTGKPVIIMNAPWFRKNVHHGLRFWQHSGIGPQVNNIEELFAAIMTAHETQDQYYEPRKTAERELYPFFGIAAKAAASALRRFLREQV